MSSNGEVYQWLDHARADLRVAAEILQPDWDYIAVVLFLVQQCAEKSLKGLLTYKHKPVPRTHNLTELRVHLDESALSELLDEIEAYSRFASTFRYPGAEEDEPGIEEAEHALEQVRRLYQAILERIPQELRPAPPVKP